MHYHECLMSNKESLKQTSHNDAKNSNMEYMTENDRDVINFDDVVEDYCKVQNIPKYHSNDALLFDFKKIDCQNDINFLFIEFKSGNINNKAKKNIKSKIEDSNHVLKEIIEEVDDDYLLHKVNYILVYDITKQSPKDNRPQFDEELITTSMSRNYLIERISALSKKTIKEKIFPYRAALGLYKYEGVILNAVKSIEVKRFNKYLEKGYITEDMFS